MATKQRSHNEWFRPVNTKAITEKRLTLPVFADYICTKCNRVSTRSNPQMESGDNVCHYQNGDSPIRCNGLLDPIPMTNYFSKEYDAHAGYVSSRKSCPTCKAKLALDEFVWSWGEYRNVRWHTVTHFCKNCFEQNVRIPLTSHSHTCGCSINLVSKGCTLPKWLTLTQECKVS